MNKRPSLFLSRARSFWRLARKAQKEGNYKLQEWYNLQAQLSYSKYQKFKKID